MKRQLAVLALTMLACGGVLSVGYPAQKVKELWLTSRGTDKVFVRELLSGRSLAEIQLPKGAQPHITTFHGDYAYVSGMGDGNVYVIDASQRKVVTVVHVAASRVHQLRVSPAGTTALVSVVGTKDIVKIAVDEGRRVWAVAGDASLLTLGKAPICSLFRSDSRRAYVSLLPNGLAIVDVLSMEVLGTLATDGFIACGMIKTRDGNHAVIASSGSGGHIYTLDMTTDSLVDRGALGATDWHSFNMDPSGTLGFGTSPMSDEIVVADLTTQPVTKMRTIALTPMPGRAANQPDALGGGDPIFEGILPVSLRAAGQLALVDAATLRVKSFIPISSPAPFDPMTCNGCAIHGVTVRP